MRNLNLCLLFVCACIALPCHARWGMTYEECVAFYGKPKKVWKADDGTVSKAKFRRVDDRRDITITATFSGLRVTNISYCCSDNSFMTTETVYAILNAYAAEDGSTKFVPLDMLAGFSEEELVKKKDVLKKSIKEQIWFLAGRKGDATLYAIFNRDAQMLSVREVKVKDVVKGAGKPAEKKKPMPF